MNTIMMSTNTRIRIMAIIMKLKLYQIDDGNFDTILYSS